MQVKVLLTQDVDKLGKAGEVRRVARGYARNFLIARGLAVVPTEGAMRHVEMHTKARGKQEAKLQDEAKQLAEKMNASPLEFKAKVGEQGRLFGSITSQDIADALGQKLNLEIDRRKIELAEPLKQAGDHQVTIRLHGEVSAVVNIKIVPEE
ncbi:MAG: 50S ribosomal protein L9 [Chloroflexi bacterium]|nr:50S ribosomal protein L9 [Chloroflexota bacterium]